MSSQSGPVHTLPRNLDTADDEQLAVAEETTLPVRSKALPEQGPTGVPAKERQAFHPG